MFDMPSAKRAVDQAKPSPASVRGGVVQKARIDVLRVLRGRWWLFIALPLVGALLVGLASLALPPRYLATASIFVDPSGLHVLNTELTQPQQDSNAAIDFIESQARIVLSQSVLSRAVASEHLGDDPEFNGGGAKFSPAHFLAGGGEAGPSAAMRERIATTNLAEHIVVHRPERTFIIEVTARANTGEKAASIANAVARAYLDSQSDARSDLARRASQDLLGRIDELRERVRQAQARVEAFRVSTHLIGTRTELISEQQLNDANARLADAKGRVVQAQARYDQTQAARRQADMDTLPEAVVSQTITALRGKQAEAKRQVADTIAEFGPMHPAVKAAQADLNGLNRAIADEIGRIATSARAELERARVAEAAEHQALATLTTEASGTSQSLSQLGELQLEVDVNRNLLNAFMSRARETSELGRLDTSNARIITVADPPRGRSFPPSTALMSLGGAMIGFMMVILIEVMWPTPALAIPSIRSAVVHTPAAPHPEPAVAKAESVTVNAEPEPTIPRYLARKQAEAARRHAGMQRAASYPPRT